MNRDFSSKRDGWLTVVILVSTLAMSAAGIGSAMEARWVIACVLFVSAAAMLWVFYGTSYTVTGTELIVRSGPLRWRVSLASIVSVEPSNDPIASPASSLDRLEIRYGGGRRLLVSPKEKEAFLEALRPSR